MTANKINPFMDDINSFPALDAATEAALRESIKRFGVLVPVVRDQHGRTLDGKHRSRIADEEGAKCRIDIMKVRDDDHAREITRTLNMDRRQMTAEQRKAVVKALSEAGHSKRAIAGAVGVDEKTVRNDLSGADCSAPEKVTGRDGKSYPAKRSTAKKGPKDPEQAELIQRMAWIDGRSQRQIVIETGLSTSIVQKYAGATAKPLTPELGEAKERARQEGRWRKPKAPEPEFEPEPEPKRQKRAENWNGKTNPKRQRELQDRKRNGDYSALLRLQLEMTKLCSVIEAYKPEEFALEAATLALIDSFHDDLVSLADWSIRGIMATQGWLKDGKMQATIDALEDRRGGTAAEIASGRLLAARLRRKREMLLGSGDYIG